MKNLFLFFLASITDDALKRARLRWPRLLAMLLLTGCGVPAPRFGIGHCGPAEVEAQRAVFMAEVIPAVTACVQNGAPEDCPEADEATGRWLAARRACR